MQEAANTAVSRFELAGQRARRRAGARALPHRLPTLRQSYYTDSKKPGGRLGMLSDRSGTRARRGGTIRTTVPVPAGRCDASARACRRSGILPSSSNRDRFR
ncbi:hypothetical protein GCM10023196_051910 [Actinoallomurus vinaceus]|uniref:Uncharacterized protein n=1 Tax=Actinoallomurus vinaceus TaxID=1080074 RepID=A0ABP8UDV6_9ACTN